jgi:hypothetical protein
MGKKDWLNYPENKPEESKDPIWYNVMWKDGTLDKACWWLGVWYCYNHCFDVVKYNPKPVSMWGGYSE